MDKQELEPKKRILRGIDAILYSAMNGQGSFCTEFFSEKAFYYQLYNLPIASYNMQPRRIINMLKAP